MQDSDVFFTLTTRRRKSDRDAKDNLLTNDGNHMWSHAGLAGTSVNASRHNDRIVVTFSGLLKSKVLLESGVGFGNDPKLCHVLVGKDDSAHADGRHFSISVDESLRIWLHNQSRSGTTVEYNREGFDQQRVNSRWLLARTFGRSASLFDDVVIHPSEQSALRIEFPNHLAGDDLYRLKLTRLRDACRKAAIACVGNAGVDNKTPWTAITQRFEMHTPLDQSPIYQTTKSTGARPYGTTFEVVQTDTGRCFAAKRFRAKWPEVVRKQLEAMRDNPHPNVLKIHELVGTEDSPMSVTDCFPSGNLDSNKTLIPPKHERAMTVFAQALAGLAHLHSLDIVHRNLLPRNLLVSETPVPCMLRVVIGDAGLAGVKPPPDLDRHILFSSHHQYLAPEILESDAQAVGKPADIWALAVVIMRANFEQLNMDTHYQSWRSWIVNWHRHLTNLLSKNTRKIDAMYDMLRGMLEKEPAVRWTAEQCLEYGLQKDLFYRDETHGLMAGRGIMDGGDDRPAPLPQPDDVDVCYLVKDCYGRNSSNVEHEYYVTV